MNSAYYIQRHIHLAMIVKRLLVNFWCPTTKQGNRQKWSDRGIHRVPKAQEGGKHERGIIGLHWNTGGLVYP